MFIDKLSHSGARLALAGVLLLTVPACAVGGGSEGGSSPEDVYERMRSAIADEDFAEIVRCMEPDKRPLFSMSFYIGATMVVALTSSMGEMMGEMSGELAVGMAEGLAEGFGDGLSEEERKKLEEQTESIKDQTKASTGDLEAQLQAVLEKHGLDPLEDENLALGEASDLEAAANEMFADVDHPVFVADLLAILDQAGSNQDDGITSEYPDADLTDVVVTGQRATGRAGEKEVEFVEVDGRWYLALDMQLGPG